MIIVWQGWGILVPIIMVVSIVTGCGIAKLLGFAELIASHTAWILALGLCLAGIVNGLLGRKINSDTVMIKDALGKEVERSLAHNDHTFFWIPMQHWLWVCMGLSLLAVYNALV